MAKEEEMNFLEKIFPFLRNPEHAKKRKIKRIAQTISRSKYKFYRYRTQEMAPDFAKFIIEIYKLTGNVAVMLKDSEKSTILKKAVIEYHLKDSQKKYLAKLTEEEIFAFAGDKDLDTISKTLTNMINSYKKEFTKEMIDSINLTYNNIIDFLYFLKYDMVYLIKRFASTGNENVPPTSLGEKESMLRAINARGLSVQIKDLQEAFHHISGKQRNWKDMINILTKFKQGALLELGPWSKMVKEIEAILSSDLLINMLRCIDEKPDLDIPKPKFSELDIVKEDLESVAGNVETILYRVATDRKNAKISQICQAIFNIPAVPPLEYFNDNLNNEVLKKNVPYLQYFDSLAITKYFLIEFFKRDCKDLQDLLLIRATWASNKSVSEKALAAYQNLLELTTKIITFDQDMSSQGQYGSKLKKSLMRLNEKSSLSKKQCEEIVDSINQYALKLIKIVATDLIVFGKCIKMAGDDLTLKEPKLITNWREIESKSGKDDMKTFIDESYKKIYYFIQILKIDIPE